MYHIDIKYLRILSPKLEGFTQKTPDLFNCKCFYCGDSQKKKSKKRGYFYKKSNNLFYRCFNCEQSTTFYKALEYLDPYLAKEYSLENYTSNVNKHTPYKKPVFNFKKPVFKTKSEIDLPSISSLEEKHYAKQYVLKRKIPKGRHKDLFYAKDFKSFVLSLVPNYDKELVDNDDRLILPFRDENGNLFAFQGRALGKNPLRYITIKLDESLKLFGLDRVNKSETIYVTEGPIDSLFVKNAVATADSNLAIAEFLGKNNIVLINDKEPRNKHIVKQIEKYIDSGFFVCLLPETFPGKDINEAVLNGLTKPEIHRIIEANTFSGLRAKLEFGKWKKI